MDTARTALQVGLLVFLAAVLFIIGYYFFFGAVHSQKYYTVTAQFDDAQGIQQGAEVDLAGVKIGEVATVKLSPKNKALVQMRILKGRRIPRASGVTIATSLLGGNSNVAITPPSPEVAEKYGDYAPGSLIIGNTPFGLSTLEAQSGPVFSQLNTTLKKADLLMVQATRTTASINRIVADPRIQASLADSMANLDQASKQGVQLTRQMQVMLAEDNNQARSALVNVTDTTGQIRDLTAANRAKLNQIVAHMNQTMATLDQLTTTLNTSMTKGDVAANLSDTVSNLKQATAQLNQIAGDIHSLTSDTQMRSDLKTTLHNVAETSGNTAQLVQRLNSLTSGHMGGGQGAFNFEGRLDFTQNFRTNKFRTDFDLFAPLSSRDFARLGVYDLTEDNRLNLQYGLRPTYNSPIDYRIGVYASKVGIGADYNLFGPYSLSMDLYNPNRLRLDTRVHIPFNKQTGLWLGLEDVPRTNGLTVGVELRR
jgi:phospholipid/cholesterol/gamma-HCH transport system substrate-binding protein